MNSGGKPPGTDSIAGGEDFAAPSVLRVIELKATENSEIEADVEAARLLLPEPAVPAPDPKMVAIPPEKVRQQVRRPAPRVKRQPLQTLEILPVQSQEASPPSSRPGSRNATGKARVEAKAKVEQQVVASAQNKEKEDGGDVVRALSGALEGDPYRWVVSVVFLTYQAVGAELKQGVGAGVSGCSTPGLVCSSSTLVNLSSKPKCLRGKDAPRK